MPNELKPCPFCGSKRIHLVDASELGNNWVRCDNCETEGPCHLTEQNAIEAWNRRAGED